MTGITGTFRAVRVQATDATIGPGYGGKLVGCVFVNEYLASVAGFTANDNNRVTTCGVG